MSQESSSKQIFAPPQRLCAHLNAFHTYASEPGVRSVEANHYCAHLNDDVRQCILYDSDKPNARLIGVEYMIKPHLFEKLDDEEKKLWHSHVFEVKSGMLFLPKPEGVSKEEWEKEELKEMEQVVTLYGKVYHLWQVDRGDELPLGPAMLMTSFTEPGQFKDWDGAVGGRDRRFGIDSAKKAELRKGIKEPEIVKGADWAWEKNKQTE
ncbi:DUF1264-domain-containing protein [Piedraia hortae CBS 480.64]|uniref:DUF1264-domain-containing protein n=1 Tax=Piedraia hortae CBS 480.64 TaxID=1314780 RepID=A0A6A7BZ52_9PEZI|nr:DUF1264-domain-containing protein [Piedraia hortae CBS 480.64]